MRSTHLLLGIAMGVALIGGCSAASTSSPAATPATSTTPASIVSERCTVCHSVDRIKAARKDAAAWQVTVDRMRGKGARLSDAEAQQVIDFLAGDGAASL